MNECLSRVHIHTYLSMQISSYYFLLLVLCFDVNDFSKCSSSVCQIKTSYLLESSNIYICNIAYSIVVQTTGSFLWWCELVAPLCSGANQWQLSVVVQTSGTVLQQYKPVAPFYSSANQRQLSVAMQTNGMFLQWCKLVAPFPSYVNISTHP